MESPKPELKLVSNKEASGPATAMVAVVKEFFEHRNPEPVAPSPGLSARYQSDPSPTKGLLLNKKAE